VSVSAQGLGDWVGNIGVSDQATGVPYTENMHQRIGSITKTFVGTLVLQLVDQGLLSLDDTVDQWFEGVTYGDQITVRMLLNMTSGIASYTEDADFWRTHVTEPERLWTQAELLAYGFEAPPLFDPGARFHYSNTNTIMLGIIIEAVTGEDLRVVLQEGVLDPLGLTHTSFPANTDVSIPETYAHGITRNPETGAIQDATNWNVSWAWAAGQMISTQEDLRVWARELAVGELLSPAMQAERLTWVAILPDVDFGYGLGVERFFGWLGHGGDLDGYNSESFYRPDLNAAILVFTNTDIRADGQQKLSSILFYEIAFLLNREYPLPPLSD
jgi:D-alanyl-D-alanine carboxypeptidase